MTRLWRRWARKSGQNALEIWRLGRLGSSEGMPYEVVDRIPECRLRRYRLTDAQAAAPLLLVPPLMLTAEIYDVEPANSAVRALAAAGIEPWVVDFGAPEREEGGMDRTLDDHVRAVAWAIARVKRELGRDVHVAGYSQGGMFAYQAAAFTGGDGVASLVTYGSPVDIHKNVPAVDKDLVGRFVRSARPVVEIPLRQMRGLPGTLSSTGFKILSPRKELEQLVDFVRKLHDRKALERRESRRLFLAGEGFVAWPGPALQRFFQEFIVENRMMSGGFVIDDRPVTLADIDCPILYFVGDRDDFARPASVRAIRKASPRAECHEVILGAGHFGLVVGSTAQRDTWPATIDWIRWREGLGPQPKQLAPLPPPTRYSDEPEELIDIDVDFELLGEVSATAKQAWMTMGRALREAGETADNLRWQVPRLAKLERMSGASRISPSLMLAKQARTIGDRTFFLWRGRAFSYADADERVGHVADGLLASGMRRGDRVGVWMSGRPSFLSAVTAIGRLGAVAVLVPPDTDPDDLPRVLRAAPCKALIVDPERAEDACRSVTTQVLVLGGGAQRPELPREAIDMEAIDVTQVVRPSDHEPDPGRARDDALWLARVRDDDVDVARVSNGRWAFSALGAASSATLTPGDTVYACLPLHHPAGILVSVGGALAGGARLALAERFDPTSFWDEVRRYGATVVFYAGDMARPLVDAPTRPGEREHPVRLFAGSGMRVDVWRRLTERFGVGVLEFYAATERNLVLANASGEKVGALGRPLPGSVDLAIVRYDFAKKAFIERGGKLERCLPGEPGVAIVRLRPDRPERREVRRDAFAPGDRWGLTGDVLTRDEDGDCWFVDRLDNITWMPEGLVTTPRIEDALYLVRGVRAAVVVPGGGQSRAAAYVEADALDPDALSDVLERELAPHERPAYVTRLAHVPRTLAHRPDKGALKNGPPSGSQREVLIHDASTGRYAPASYRRN